MKYDNYIMNLRDVAIKRVLNLKKEGKEVFVSKSISKNLKSNNKKIKNKNYFIIENLFDYNEWKNIAPKNRQHLGRVFYEEILANYSNIVYPIDRPKTSQKRETSQRRYVYRKELIKMTANDLLNETIKELSNLNEGEIFFVRELFKGYRWNRIERSKRLLLGTLFLNKVQTDFKDKIEPLDKTVSGQKKYKIIKKIISE